MERISLRVKGTPLIKFKNAKRIQSLREGHLYAKNLQYYRNLEKETGDTDIGDEFEAMLHVNRGFLHFPETGVTEELNDTLIQTSDSNIFVFCVFGIYPSLKSFQFSDMQKEKILSLGDTALVITDSDEFQRRVFNAAKREGYEPHFGAAQYYDPSTDWANMFMSLLNGMWNIALWKRKDYSYQQEGRFIFTPGSDKDHIDLDIGDISDISMVFPAETVLSANVEKIL